MYKLIFLLLLLLFLQPLTTPVAGQSTQQRTFTSATNFSTDITGDIDTRPGTWGRAGYSVWKITFKPPTGQSVRIRRVYGDLVSWAVGKVNEGTHAGVLFGLQTTAPDGSANADLIADNCFLYLQDVVAAGGKRTPFDISFDEVYLEKDHVLVVKVAAWLNDTGLPVHMEPTFSVVYSFTDSFRVERSRLTR